jgi:hypothetical protein
LPDDANLVPPERPITRRLEAALTRLETAAQRATVRCAAMRALETAAEHALAELDAALADPHG